jgi:thioredoxin reductase (NADPH)
VFCFIGAAPNTDWLKRCTVEVDDKGFVLTGEAAVRDGADLAGQPPLSFETSQPGVFAIGDVRAGSVKRVSAAVGEGAALVAQLHKHLQASRQEAIAASIASLARDD